MIAKRGMLVAAVTCAVVMSVSQAFGQYTPGSGGYLPPSAPSMPQPDPYQSQPYPQQQPRYSWELPPSPQPQPVQVAQPDQPDLVRIDPSQPTVVIPQLSDAQLADLTASIALYPDALLAEMLPASTYVEELTYADRWMAQHPGADEHTLGSLPLDDSVIAIMHYPTVLKMLTDHLDWTQAVGVAFQYQRADVMESVQRWRLRAVESGALASSPQQDVFRQGQMILIVPPPRQQVVYVPVYDPEVVYVRHERPIRDMITFSGGGFSLSFVDNDLDWRGRDVRVPEHRRDWDDHRDDRDRGNRGPDRGPGGGRAGGPPPPPEPKKAFVKNDVKPKVVYPSKIETPTGHKEVTLPPSGIKPGLVAPQQSPPRNATPGAAAPARSGTAAPAVVATPPGPPRSGSAAPTVVATPPAPARSGLVAPTATVATPPAPPRSGGTVPTLAAPARSGATTPAVVTPVKPTPVPSVVEPTRLANPTTAPALVGEPAKVATPPRPVTSAIIPAPAPIPGAAAGARGPTLPTPPAPVTTVTPPRSGISPPATEPAGRANGRGDRGNGRSDNNGRGDTNGRGDPNGRGNGPPPGTPF